jgi:rhomboid protease GluP
MYCLATAGPVVERLFGHLGFAGLYLIAGAGGAIASLCVHPTVISAGASGAIFGVFGALLGFLALRHDEVPADRLRPMAGGTLAFVGYNLLFGLGAPGIDMAAHLGGLVIGFGGGLLLTAATPARSSAPGGPGPAMGRLAAMAALSLVLAGAWPRASGTAREGILADPRMGRAIAAELDAVDAWNAFSTAAAPLLRDFDRVADEMQRVLSGAEEGRIQDDAIGRAVDRLRRDCRALDPRVAGLPAGNPEIRAMRDRIVAGHSLQLRMLDAIEQFLRTGDESHLKGPGGLSASGEAYGKEFEAMGNQREAYFRAHSMRPMDKKP